MVVQIKVFSKTNAPLSAVIVKLATTLSEKHTKLLAETTKELLLKNIEESRVRTQKPNGPHLRDGIEIEQVEGGRGVGNFETLNKKTPWWAWINYGRAFSGREIPPGYDENQAIAGHFEPQQGGIFTAGQPKYPMNPKKPIAAHNYIEKTLAFMFNAIKSGGLLK